MDSGSWAGMTEQNQRQHGFRLVGRNDGAKSKAMDSGSVAGMTGEIKVNMDSGSHCSYTSLCSQH
jgi:hypothetical protein